MKYEDLEKLAEKGKLFVCKHFVRENTRNQYIYDKKHEYPHPDYYKILEVKKLKYKIYSYQAYTLDMPHNTFYKITSKDYKNLVLSGAIPK